MSGEFAATMRSLLSQAPADRHRNMLAWHRRVSGIYRDRLRAINPEEARRPSSDGRTLALVVGHITAWDSWLIQAGGEVLSGCPWPDLMELRGYLTPTGERRAFDSLDGFNAYQAKAQETIPWERIRDEAQGTAAALYALYAGADLLTPERLQATREYRWRIEPGERIPVPVGWYLWGVVLEHMGYDHADDLKLSIRG